ncbi:hypothetical protein TRVL_03129 [Trypanosoma vivax]|nr:hypothetical protein TRVL_03129 [Trypanosoma vivax]
MSVPSGSQLMVDCLPEGGLEELLYALFPRALQRCIRSAVLEKTVEGAVQRVHAETNLDIQGASFLMSEKDKKTSEAIEKEEEMMLKSLLDELSGNLDSLRESVFTFVSSNYEYNATVKAFCVDTAAWDERFIAAPVITDVVGGRPLALHADRSSALESCGSLGAPIVRWVKTVQTGADARGSASGLHAVMSSGNSSGGGIGPAEVNHSDTSDDCGALAPNVFPEAGVAALTCSTDYLVNENEVDQEMAHHLKFTLERLKRCRDAMKELLPWQSIFSNNGCFVFKEVSTNCGDALKLITDLFPAVLHAAEKELVGKKVISSTKGLNVSFLGKKCVDIGSCSVQKLVFGRSYAVVKGDGDYLQLRLKLKRLELSPLDFYYRSQNSKSDNGTRNVAMLKVKNCSIKTKVTVALVRAGVIRVECRDNNVNIGSVDASFSSTKLNFAYFFLKPFIRRSIRAYILDVLKMTNSLNAF